MTPRYKYLNSAGEHVHTLDGHALIGTSRVGSILAKPLTWWASGLAVQTFGCPDPKVLTKIKNGKATAAEKQDHARAMEIAHTMFQHMSVAAFSALIDKAYRAHATTLKEKAVAGTDLHAELERFVKDQMDTTDDTVLPDDIYDVKIHPFIEWSRENVKRFLYSEGHCFSERYWLGGISDAGYEKHDGTFGIIDFKSSKEAYIEQFWQCAGYDIEIAENGVVDADGNLIYTLEKPIQEYCIFAFGAPKPRPQFNFDMAGSKEAFLACLTIYQKLPQD